jgi:uncharacterized protein (DUF885 family)
MRRCKHRISAWRAEGAARVLPLLLTLGCASRAAAPSGSPEARGSTAEKAAAPSAPAELKTLVSDCLAAKLAFEPSLATALGLHTQDERLEDFSRARIDARVSELGTLSARLARIDRSALDFQSAIDAEALGSMLGGDLQSLSELRPWQHNPMFYAGLPGMAVDGLMKRDFAPARERLRSIVARLEQIPALYAAARANLDNPPREFTDLALRMAKGSSGFFESSVVQWSAQARDADPALRAAFERANAAANTATRAFADWLEQDLAPRSRGNYAIGAERFLAKLKYDELIELPLPELLARGTEQLERDYARFVATAREIDPTHKAAEVSTRLSNEHPTAEDLIPSVRRSLDSARQFLVDRDLITLPSNVPPRVEETPAYARAGIFASMDTPGPFEPRATEGFYYVTPVEPTWDAKHREEHLRLFNPYVVAMINVHEVYPGHYVQFLYAPRLLNDLRKVYAAASNAEGWAHYSEQMMVEEGFGADNPKYRLAQLQEALLRDCRYVAGIGLHTDGWSVERAQSLFVEKGFQEVANAREEALRGTYNPTYLYYTLGKLEIYDLRRDYQAKYAASLKQFHDAFVAQGALPIPLVRRLLLEQPASAPHLPPA